MKKYTIKHILLSNNNWWDFYNKFKNKIRPDIIACVVKLLSCKHSVRGYKEYCCSNPKCSHLKLIFHTCKCKACSSCGKKATEIWIEKQNQLLPNTSWQHITFTMPCQLWDFFWLNRSLLNFICKIAADCIKTIASNKGIIPGIFIAIHTFGRDLKRNVHIHVSTTTGGLADNGTTWKKIFFKQNILMSMWRYKIIKLFRKQYYQKLIIPNSIQKQFNHTYSFNNFLNLLHKKKWVVHCSKPSSDHKVNVNYLARYTKRPAIAESKLKHYDGNEVTFKYLDHTSKTYRKFTLTTWQFIGKFIQHIPDINFKMIRYYGFLANPVRGKLLPAAYSLLNQKNDKYTTQPSYSQLMQRDFNVDPFKCILCGAQLVLRNVVFGITNVRGLVAVHRELALLKKI